MFNASSLKPNRELRQEGKLIHLRKIKKYEIFEIFRRGDLFARNDESELFSKFFQHWRMYFGLLGI